jgi:predicted lysophospholipase L1 biosynthesis ABC-type transport system permease subunit
MSIAEIKQGVAHLEATMGENMLITVVLIIAVGLALLLFGGLLLDAYIEKRRERQKAQAVERLHKHLQSLPSSKS